MSTRWEALMGDTSRFAVKMAFAEDKSEISLPLEMTASWGSFEIWIRGANLCAHVEEGEALDAVHWYLLPLLEWLVDNWNALLHEERLPVRNAGQDAVASLYRTRFPAASLSEDSALAHDEDWYAWRQRHAIHAARDGGLFPEIFFRRWEDQVEVSWSNQAPPGSPEGFAFLVPYGRALLDPDEVAQPLFGVMRRAAEQLHVWEPESARLEELRASIAELNKPRKQRSARLDWLFNLSISDGNAEPTWEAVRSLFARTTSKIRRAVLEPAGSGLVLRGSSHAVLLFGSVDPNIARDDARELADQLVALFDETGDSPALLELVDDATSAVLEGLPWEQGYELAEQIHQALSADRASSRDVEGVLADLEIDVGAVRLSDPRIRGVAIAGPQHQPAVLTNETHPRNQSPEGRRFTLAHEFCHLIVDRRIGRRLAVASGPWAPIEVEQRANAFAAYFLMPPEEVQTVVARLSDPVASSTGIRAVADEFGTSPRATLEHLHNLGWLDEFERDMLRGTGLDDESFSRPAAEIGG
jgi:Zn-dependent peptidase ImmA (M78 family)